MSILNVIIDKVYVINLDKDTARMKIIDAQLKKHNIEYTRFSAIDGSKVDDDSHLTPYCNNLCTDGMKGCALSHRAIWEIAVLNNYSNICIFEDDATLSDTFNDEFQNIWKQVPKDYDIFYLGCGFHCTDTGIPSKAINAIHDTAPTHLSKNVLNVSGSIGTHGYIISNKCAKIFYTIPISTHIDWQIGDWIKKFKLSAYSANPLLVWTFENETSATKSNLSESYPYILNSILHYIPISDDFNLDWALSENFMKLGPININGLIAILFFAIIILPSFIYNFIIAWLLIEFIVSLDLKSTLKFSTVSITAYTLRYVLYTIFIKYIIRLKKLRLYK